MIYNINYISKLYFQMINKQLKNIIKMNLTLMKFSIIRSSFKITLQIWSYKLTYFIGINATESILYWETENNKLTIIKMLSYIIMRNIQQSRKTCVIGIFIIIFILNTQILKVSY